MIEVKKLSVTDAIQLVAAGRGVLVDTRDARLYDNLHAAGAVSLPVSHIDGAELPPDRTIILYCA